MDESPERTIFLHDGEVLTVAGLARKLKGAIFELTQDEIATDEDTALAALAAFDAGENITGTMSAEELEAFCDDFCNAWAQDTP